MRWMIVLLVVFWISVGIGVSRALAAEIPLVWSEVDVDRTPAEYRGDMRYPDICVGLPEVTNRQDNKLYRLTAPGRLKRRDKNGIVTTLYDCKASGQLCVPTDPRISFDGTKVAFTIYRGTQLEPQCNSKNMGLAGQVGANIGVVDLTTGQVTEWPYVPGRFDLTPTFINQGGAVRILFSSDRDREYMARTSTLGYVNERYPNLQTFIADIDGSNTVKTGYHDMAAFYGGWQMKDGRVMGSCAQRNHDLTFRDGGASINFPGTHTNDWWVCGQDPWGGSQESLFGAHYRLVAQHYFTQLSDGRVCTDDYYRGNYNLTGRLLCWTPQPFTVEGYPTKEAMADGAVPDVYRADQGLSPRDLFDPAPWSNAADTKSTWNEAQNRWEGRLRDPFGLPDGDLGVVWCDGICNQRAGAPAAEYTDEINLGPERTLAGVIRERTQIAHPVGAQYGIYYLPKERIPSTTSLDLVKLIDDPNVNEFGAIYGGPYVDVYGQAMPDTMARPASPDGNCYLHIASQISDTTSLKVLSGEHQWGYLEHTGTFGKELVGVTDADVKFIRISKVMPNKEVQTQYVGTDPKSQWFSAWGFKNETLGDAPVEADGSVKAQIPCDTPFLLQGLNARHEVVKRDMVVQSLRPASVLTCTGCHDHNDLPNKPDFAKSIAATKPATVLDGSTNTPQPELNADIYPVIQRNCGACHDDSQKPNLRERLYETLLMDYKQETNPNPVLARPDTPQHAGGKRTWIDRPHLSWLVNGSHAAGSALYWYLTDARRDYLTNASYPDDLDFNEAHPKVNASASDIALVRDWIDRGALHDPKVKSPVYGAPVEPPHVEQFPAGPAVRIEVRRVGAQVPPLPDQATVSIDDSSPAGEGTRWIWYGPGEIAIEGSHTVGWSYAVNKHLIGDQQIMVWMHGSSGGPASVNKAFGLDANRAIELRTMDQESFGSEYREWWTWSHQGDLWPSARIAAMLDYALPKYPQLNVDTVGITLAGKSMGGAGAITQAQLLPDHWRSKLAVDRHIVGVVMPRRVNQANPGQYANYPPDTGPGSLWDKFDFALNAKTDKILRNLCYQGKFSTTDQFSDGPDGNTQVEWVNILEEEKLCAAAFWVANGHSPTEAGVNNGWLFDELDEWQKSTLDRPVPAITHSTGNWPPLAAKRIDESAYPRGHYNVGIQWDHANITESPDQVSIPLRYVRHTDIGGGIPDQPEAITVSVTPRRLKAFTLRDGEHVAWTFGLLSGVAKVSVDTVTVDGLPLVSGGEFMSLEIRHE